MKEIHLSNHLSALGIEMGTEKREFFFKFCGLLPIYQLYQKSANLEVKFSSEPKKRKKYFCISTLK
jgi:hypothetical protein